jgi:hypothetical protein
MVGIRHLDADLTEVQNEMSGGHTASINGGGQTIAHLLADRERFQAALEQDLPEEKRAEVSARLAAVEANLAEIREAIG